MRGYGSYQEESSEKLFEIDNSGKGDSHMNFSWGPCDNVYQNLNFKKIWKNYFDKSCYMAKLITELAIDSLELNGVNWEHSTRWSLSDIMTLTRGERKAQRLPQSSASQPTLMPEIPLKPS